jgi:CheY-like chemotaxis protein
MNYPFSVLMIEDDPPTLSLLAAIAKREGFDALLADDGEKAMSVLKNHTVDAIVLDLLLPRTNGFDILRHCKSTAPSLLERTIVITAAPEPTYRGCEELRHVRRFYRKPLDFVDLTSALHACRAARPLPERAGDGSGANVPPPRRRLVSTRSRASCVANALISAMPRPTRTARERGTRWEGPATPRWFHLIICKPSWSAIESA